MFAYQNKLKGHHNFIAAPNPEALFAPALYYRQSLDYLKYDMYDYVIIVPWLIAGGADKFFMNYANTITKLRQNKRVLVISTEPARDSLSRDKLMLHKDIDFLPIAEIIKNIDSYSTTCQAYSTSAAVRRSCCKFINGFYVYRKSAPVSQKSRY